MNNIQYDSSILFDGKLEFRLRKDIPKELICDLLEIQRGRECEEEKFIILRNTRWVQHKYFKEPKYEFYANRNKNNDIYYVLNVNIRMRGYLYGDRTLGDLIYEALEKYIDRKLYDFKENSLIGSVVSELSHVYLLYIDEQAFENEKTRRKPICNGNCCYYSDYELCNKYRFCGRAFDIGRDYINNGDIRLTRL